MSGHISASLQIPSLSLEILNNNEWWFSKSQYTWPLESPTNNSENQPWYASTSSSKIQLILAGVSLLMIISINCPSQFKSGQSVDYEVEESDKGPAAKNVVPK